MGDISSPTLGNFSIFGGTNTNYMALQSNRGSFNSAAGGGNNAGTVFYGLDGQIAVSDNTYSFWPFFQSYADGGGGGIGESDTAIIELPIYRASVYLVDSRGTRYGNQIGDMPAIYCNAAACVEADWLDRVYVGDDLKTQFTIAGKTFFKVRLIYNVAFLSLDASDWA